MDAKIENITKLDFQSTESSPILLGDVLAAMEPWGKDYEWSIQHLWMVGHVPGEKSTPEFELRVRTSPHGHLCTWSTLCGLNESAEQVIEIFLVAGPKSSEFKRFREDQDAYRFYPITIERSDSGLWSISCRDRNLSTALQERLMSQQG